MTITEKLRELANQTKLRLGEHPDYFTILEAVDTIEKMSEPRVETVSETKPKRTRKTKT